MHIQLKAVIFDLDGVVINSNTAIELFWTEWASREGIELNESLISEWIYGRKVTETLQGLFHQCSKEKQDEIEADAYIFDRSMNPGEIPGVTQFLQTLYRWQIPVGVVTSSHPNRMLSMLRKLAVETLFSHFVSASDVSKGKPHPEPYLKMSEKMSIDPSACLVFEDAVSGIISANTAGMQVIGIGNKKTAPYLLNHGAKDVISDFTSLILKHRSILTTNGTLFSL